MDANDDLFRAALDTMLDCVSILSAVRDADGRITDFRIEYQNDAACANNRVQPGEQVGKLLCEVLPGHRQLGLFDDYVRIVETGEPLLERKTWYVDDFNGQRLARHVDIRASKLGDGFLTAWRDVTAGRELEERFARAEQALRENDRRKDEFLAMLSHELRNPLAPIRNAAQLLRRGGGDPRLLEVIDRQTEQLRRLVDDLLDVARVTQGKIALQKEPLELRQVIAQAVETTRPLIEAKGQVLELSLPGEPVPLEADLARLAQAVANLLNNAAKYSDAGGRIGLRAEARGDEVSIAVSDDGVGIGEADLPRIFELFAQAQRSIDRAQGGLGVGLTLVRTLTEMHGGRVSAHSEGVGRGSTFTLVLPIARGAPQVAKRQAAPGPGTRKRVLVVDDNVDAAEMVGLLLSNEGHQIRLVHDGPSALETARAFAPELVLLDLGLPGMSGYEVAARLRADPAHAGLVLVALSGYGRDEDKRSTRDAGFHHHLTKPVELDELGELVRRPAGTRDGE